MGSDARAERRRLERDSRKRTTTRLVGDGIVATSLGHTYRATGGAQLPDKVPGRHRFVATAAYVLDDAAAAEIWDDTARHVLGPGKMMHMAAWCWDCEQPLGGPVDDVPGITWDSPCPDVGAVTGERPE